MLGSLTAPVLSVRVEEFTNEKGNNIPFCQVIVSDSDGFLQEQRISSISLNHSKAIELGLDKPETVKAMIGKVYTFEGSWTYQPIRDQDRKIIGQERKFRATTILKAS